MAINFNDAPEQKDFSDLIPGGTLARLKLEIIKPEGPDVGSMPGLTRSATSTAEMVNCSFKIVSAPLQGRQLWQNLTVLNSSQKAIDINRALIRGILESARGIKPNDVSDLAARARQLETFLDLDGIEFVGKIAIEPPKDGYGAKNKLAIAITPDKPEYQAVMNGATTVGAEVFQNQAGATGGKGKAAGATTGGAPAHQWPSLANNAAANQQAQQPANPQAPTGANPLPAWARG